MSKKKVATQITEAELQEVQKYVGALQQIQMQIGSHELAKQEMMENVKALRENLSKVRAGLEEAYGDVSINLPCTILLDRKCMAVIL